MNSIMTYFWSFPEINIIIISFYYLPRKFMCIKNWKARFKTLLMLAWVKKCFPRLLNSISLSYCKMICMYQTINNVPIKLQNFGFQSQFSMSKIICIFLFFFIEEYHFMDIFFVIDSFWKLKSLNHFIF